MGPLEALLPHRPPLVLLDGVRRVTDELCHAWLRVSPQAWYAQADGSMPAWFGIELMAQAIAAYSGSSSATQGQPPRIGFLLGTQSYACSLDAFPAGAVIEILARPCFRDDSGLFAFQCELRIADTRIAHSTLKVFQKP